MVTATATRKTARDLVADYLRQEILSTRFAPGRKLNVAEFAMELQVSHTPTREALQLLASEGLVTINAYRGAYVAELTADEYEEIFLMRVGLEGLAARLGTERISDEDIDRARHQLDQLWKAAEKQDIEQFIQVDREFHRIHYLASGRDRLWERIITLRFAAERYTRLAYALPKAGLRSTAERHGALMTAVEQHDSKRAEAEIVTDLTETFNTVHHTLQDEAAET